MTEPVLWTDPLVHSARTWLAEALTAWVASDHAKVVTLAPIAAEHLSKAALWHRNPVLLAPLDKKLERSFFTLATDPDLNAPHLRTVGLADALARISAMFEANLPVNTRRLIECRGGAVHLGRFTEEDAQYVLTDVLTLFRLLADLMSINPRVLFGIHSETAEHLLDERRSQKQRAVDLRLARAKTKMRNLANSVGNELLSETIAQKEALATTHIPQLISRVAVASKHKCPACLQHGMLLGELETDPQVEIESKIDGEINNVSYDYYLIPHLFYCSVCGFILHDTEELGFFEVQAERFKLADDEITRELIEYAQDQEAWLREAGDADY